MSVSSSVDAKKWLRKRYCMAPKQDRERATNPEIDRSFYTRGYTQGPRAKQQQQKPTYLSQLLHKNIAMLRLMVLTGQP